MRSDLPQRIRRAMGDPLLSGNVIRATDTSVGKRAKVVQEREDWEELRDRAAAVKARALSRLDHYLEEFVRNARERGAHVYFARDAKSACRIVTGLARRKGATRILKAKSMTSEEIGLNEAFAAKGMEPLETDLGEYIVQLLGDKPSHITAPALHLSTEQIHEVFKQNGVTEGRGTAPEDRRELARWLSLCARAHLRERLLDADMGVTGANMLVAETGGVVLVENEGNIRLSVTSAPVQVVLAGIEKIVPRFRDVGTILPLLVRSATGQRLSSYVQLITGALTELHIVLLDNGRVEALKDPGDREVLRCIRCGACMNACPVYRTVGGHAYGWAYPGPVGSLLTPILRGGESDHDLPFLSTLCGACTEVCPVEIDLHRHLLRLRHRAVRERRRRPLEALAFRAFRFVMQHPALYRALSRHLPRLMGRLPAWTRYRDAPPLPHRSFHRIWREDGPPAPTNP